MFMNRKCDPANNYSAQVAEAACPLSAWSVWSPCNTNCGAGISTRVRYTLPPSRQFTSASCATAGPFLQSMPCVLPTPCPLHDHCPVDAAWSQWGACSSACGGGVQTRVRAVQLQHTVAAQPCGPVLQARECNMQPCVFAGGALAVPALPDDAATGTAALLTQLQ